MRITRLEAENFKRLKAVDITPDANTVVIAGRNAQGKSSVLDAIWAALAGRSGAKELVRPIRDGESKATVVIELDDLRIERKWTASGSNVTVSPKEGNARLNSPQKVLDGLIGALAFDPLEFAESDPKKQVSTLIDLIGREAFEQVANQRASAYDERTEVNRQVKSVRARREALGKVEEVQPVDVGAVVDELDVARRKSRLLEEYHRVDAERQRLVTRLEEIKAEGVALPQTRTVETLVDLLSEAEKINESARRYDQAATLDEELEQVEGESERLSSLVLAADHERAGLIANAELPVEGLTFDDDGISYNGVPFVQSSAAERLKVSVAMAMAMNPELRVICIRDASLLDSESKHALIDMATEHDYQIWYEIVGDGGSVGVVIEDGQVQS